MSVRSVVHKDIVDARRSRIVQLVGVHYALLVVLFFVQVRLGDAEGGPEHLLALWNLVFVGAVFVPAIALVAAYLAIAGERESGSIKYLLSTPISRRDVVLGKFVSRASIVTVALVLAFAVAAMLAFVWFGLSSPGVFLTVAALTTVYALAYVAVAIGISAATASRSRAMIGVLGFYFATNFVTLNDDVSGLAGLEYVLNDLIGLGIGDDPIQFIGMIMNPTRAYLLASIGAFPEELINTMAFPAPAELAWYVQPEAAIVVLIAWLVMPILAGIYWFERTEIA